MDFEFDCEKIAIKPITPRKMNIVVVGVNAGQIFDALLAEYPGDTIFDLFNIEVIQEYLNRQKTKVT